MPDRNDGRYIERAALAFTVYCDEEGLSFDEGRTLADQLGDELADVADSRATYVPTEEA